MMKGGMMYSKGDVVIVRFPFSDLITFKKRPMLILGYKGNDVIGCAITSNPDADGVSLTDFSDGGLPFKSKAKYWNVHTILASVIDKKVAKISKDVHKKVFDKIVSLMKV